jgi:hypothetical protein
MKIRAAFHPKIGKTIAFIQHRACICLMMTMYKGSKSCEQFEKLWSELKRHH